MKETVNNEISNLFQELIVSKIKIAIEELGDKLSDIENTNDEITESIVKLPKTSGIKKIVVDEKEAIITHIDDCFGKVKTEKYLKDIVTFLKQQFAFSNNQALCAYLENISEDVGRCIDEVVSSQQCIEEKIDTVNELLVTYKKELIDMVVNEKEKAVLDINNSLNHLKILENEIIAAISSHEVKFNNISDKTDTVKSLVKNNSIELSHAVEERKKINEQLQLLKPIFEMLEVLDRTIGRTENNDALSIREFIGEIDGKIKSIQDKCSSLEKKMDNQKDEITGINRSLEAKIKVLTIINSISIAGIVVLILLHFF